MSLFETPDGKYKAVHTTLFVGRHLLQYEGQYWFLKLGLGAVIILYKATHSLMLQFEQLILAQPKSLSERRSLISKGAYKHGNNLVFCLSVICLAWNIPRTNITRLFCSSAPPKTRPRVGPLHFRS
jgi:hypothetical protein